MLISLCTVYTFCILMSSLLLGWSQAEVYTSVAELEFLLETQKDVIDDLNDYIQEEEQRISVLKRQLHNYQKEHKEAMKDIPSYIGNPINAFTLIKRLTTDLDNIERSIEISAANAQSISVTLDGMDPTKEDLHGAARALIRLQETYDLKITDLSEGILNGSHEEQNSAPMSSSDCFELGKALYIDTDYKNSIAWMMEALRKYRENPGGIHPYNDVDMMEFISFSYYLINDINSALDWTVKVLAEHPNHPRVAGNVPHLVKLLEDQENKYTESKPKDKKPKSDVQSPGQLRNVKFNLLCRGEVELPTELTKQLKCRYLTENHPFLRLAPIKMEQIYITPDIFIFYDVMSDDEIEVLKEISMPKLHRALVHDPITGKLVSATYRINKSAFLYDVDDDVVGRITQRIEDFTGLSMTYAEELQVANYGVAGHYGPHYDCSLRKEEPWLTPGTNRIATVMFYMSNVTQGGATVFIELGLSLTPIKNAAVFWYNLHPSGQADLATIHAACPVLKGSKWVVNKWIHEDGQELIKPCTLEYQEEGFISKPPPPVVKSSSRQI